VNSQYQKPYQKFKLSRKRKKKYKKDLAIAFCKHWLNAYKNSEKSTVKLGSVLLLNTSFYNITQTQYELNNSKENWEWFYHKHRVEVRNMRVIINYPIIATIEELSEWYKINCPNDKLAQHYLNQNLYKWHKNHYANK